MKEVIIKYKNSKTLEALKDLSKYYGFTVSAPRSKKGEGIIYINDVPVIKGDNSMDINELTDIFTGKDLDATNLRKSEWQRKK